MDVIAANDDLKKNLFLLLFIICVIQQKQFALISSFFRSHFSLPYSIGSTKRNKFQLVQVVMNEGYYFRLPRRMWMRIRSRLFWTNVLKYADEEY